ncbi:sensor histidine kinase [Rhizorhabdus dicambivorans]|uniref:histidine kinase n=1 Tax=Rhizorhabdus dicambivorans TaxID=1850238 RepID=A0A2A4FUQ0_9SPHN|nr:HAMP domain-containing sensor histidine kinase [Rhizorhabdus dicambivorans]ATE65749.1 sensor histidine kinase [Rhizorhabdus dicambivorans]PCE41168.1 sensor histidine kinase [Rhizorhabdus dicambivorans]
MRTPLARLKFHLHDAPDEIRDKVAREIDEIEHLIGTTMEFVDSESRIHTTEPVDLSLLVEGVVDDLSDMGLNVLLTEPAPATIQGDPILLRRMFVNLCNNAVTYGHACIVTIETNASHVVVELRDRGGGMPVADLERAFEPFTAERALANARRAVSGLASRSSSRPWKPIAAA